MRNHYYRSKFFGKGRFCLYVFFLIFYNANAENCQSSPKISVSLTDVTLEQYLRKSQKLVGIIFFMKHQKLI